MLYPVVPPREPILTRDQLDVASSLLDDINRSLLATRQAEQMQVTGALAVRFSLLLGLEGDEVTRAIMERAAHLQPSYRDYVNQLLSQIVAVCDVQSIVNTTPVTTVRPQDNGEAVYKIEEQLPHITTETNEISEAQPSGKTLDLDTIDFQPYPETVVLHLPSKIHRLPLQYAQELLGLDEIGAISINEFQVLVLLLRDQINATKLQSVGPKGMQKWITIYEQLMGLYSPVLTQIDVGILRSTSSSNISTGFANFRKKFVSTIHEDIARGLIERAKLLAKHDKNICFGSNVEEPDEKKPPAPLVTEEPIRDSEPNFKYVVHQKTPVEMKNFLRLVFSDDLQEEVETLTPVQSAWLTDFLYSYYTDLEVPSITEDSKRNRLIIIERSTGVYSEPVDIEIIAIQRNMQSTQVRIQLERAAKSLRKHLGTKGLKAIIDDSRTRHPS